MESIGVSELRTNLLKILKRIEAGDSVIITSRGRKIARLMPLVDSMTKARQALSDLQKTAVVKDVLSPVDETWDALQ